MPQAYNLSNYDTVKCMQRAIYLLLSLFSHLLLYSRRDEKDCKSEEGLQHEEPEG